MWGAYRQAKNAKLVGCWAHVRRKFFEANPKNSKTSLSAEGLITSRREISKTTRRNETNYG